jgi:hypothetical protein
MISDDSEYEANDVPSGLLEGLEQLARQLDAQRYPGPAWSFAPAPCPQPRGKQVARGLTIVKGLIATGLAAAACVAIAAIVASHAPGPSAAPPPALAVETSATAAAQGKDTKLPEHPAAENAVVANEVPQSGSATPGDEVAENSGPQVVVVEDLDSYSVIDMSGDSPLVSYMPKDSSSLEYPLPVLLGPGPPPDGSHGML